MKIRLVPKGHDYFGAFMELAANLESSARLFQRFLSDYDNRKSRAGEILELEHVGDKLVHDVVHQLNNSFITPILDHIEATADSMILYKVDRPTTQLIRQADIIAEATVVLRRATENIEDRAKVREFVIEINRLENDGDRVVRDAIAELFNDSMSCTDIIKWKDIYETMESAIDDCEHVANILESIVLKNH